MEFDNLNNKPDFSLRGLGWGVAVRGAGKVASIQGQEKGYYGPWNENDWSRFHGKPKLTQ